MALAYARRKQVVRKELLAGRNDNDKICILQDVLYFLSKIVVHLVKDFRACTITIWVDITSKRKGSARIVF